MIYTVPLECSQVPSRYSPQYVQEVLVYNRITSMRMFHLLQDSNAWTLTHVSIVKDLVEVQYKQYQKVSVLTAAVVSNAL